ncbi:MAG: heme lyase CcmF/NrfE family subunit [Pseudomonadales bacterium]|nr:heme lyase CcmF/NrfE family subunit [Pseudomonadales bacterium]
MIPEIGHYALIISFCFSVALGVLPMVGVYRNNSLLIWLAKPLVAAQFLFMAISFGLLTWSFAVDDFSVIYVASNSNRALPMIYKITAVWGAHEGSLLLWALILAGWAFAVSCFSRKLPDDIRAMVLSIMGLISVGFSLFLLYSSNPFLRFLPGFPADGNDLNPLLQDFGLIVHPPMLYAGYVGFSVAFSFAIAALLSGRLDASWARWSRPWTNIAWVFLTLGITLGSWWAYYELGWGGWWFWDPVENASFMPWLVGTALLHSLAVTEKRGAFKSWTVLLAISAFSLSLLGTFLVRSGVLTSVHAFAVDPERGLYILLFLAVVIGSSLTIYAVRAPTVKSHAVFELFSRETVLLFNNIILLVATMTVLLGTFYPLIYEATSGGKISVGPPYFNLIFAPLILLILPVMAIVPQIFWKRSPTKDLVKKNIIPLVCAIAIGFTVWYSGDREVGGEFDLRIVLAILFAVWLLVSLARDLSSKIGLFSEPGAILTKVRLLTPGYYGMVLAHGGIAVCVVGVAMVSTYSVDKDLRMGPGDQVQMGGYQFEFTGLTSTKGPNYTALTAVILVTDENGEQWTMKPEKRQYPVRQSQMTEAAIDPGLFRDLYMALGEPLTNGAWSVRIQVKPFVRWLWLGGLLMALGGFISTLDRRYRMKERTV